MMTYLSWLYLLHCLTFVVVDMAWLAAMALSILSADTRQHFDR